VKLSEATTGKKVKIKQLPRELFYFVQKVAHVWLLVSTPAWNARTVYRLHQIYQQTVLRFLESTAQDYKVSVNWHVLMSAHHGFCAR
jgi:hypothetical protein